jgi:hypothetical protein
MNGFNGRKYSAKEQIALMLFDRGDGSREYDLSMYLLLFFVLSSPNARYCYYVRGEVLVSN